MIPRYRLRLPDCRRRATTGERQYDTLKRLKQVRAKDRRDVVRETEAAQKIFTFGTAIGEITLCLGMGPIDKTVEGTHRIRKRELRRRGLQRILRHATIPHWRAVGRKSGALRGAIWKSGSVPEAA